MANRLREITVDSASRNSKWRVELRNGSPGTLEAARCDLVQTSLKEEMGILLYHDFKLSAQVVGSPSGPAEKAAAATFNSGLAGSDAGFFSLPSPSPSSRS